MAVPMQTVAEASVNMVVGAVLVFFLAVVLLRSPWPAGTPMLTATLLALFLVPLVVLAWVTYVAAARLGPPE